jgi:hypothetical protein
LVPYLAEPIIVYFEEQNMKLQELLLLSHDILDKAKAPHAVIGAFGMSVHGYLRATNDIDFLVHGDFRDKVEQEFLKQGFHVFHSTKEALQLGGPGPVDIIFARRPLSQRMLGRKKLARILDVPVLDAEDIVGLKIQALATNPKRKFKDLGDIQALCQAKGEMDWNQIKEYADLFGVWDLISEIKASIEK